MKVVALIVVSLVAIAGVALWLFLRTPPAIRDDLPPTPSLLSQ